MADTTSTTTTTTTTTATTTTTTTTAPHAKLGIPHAGHDSLTVPVAGDKFRANAQMPALAQKQEKWSNHFGHFLKTIMIHKERMEVSSAQPTMTLREIAGAFLLGLTYCTFMFCRYFYAPITPALKDDPDVLYNEKLHGTMLIAVGVGFGLGKLISGLLVDRFNPFIMYALFMIVSGLCVVLISFTKELSPTPKSRYHYIMGINILNSFAQAGGWPALTKLVYIRINPHHHGRVFSALGLGSRFGAMCAALSVGRLLKYYEWEKAILLAPVMMIVSLVALFAFRLVIPTPTVEQVQAWRIIPLSAVKQKEKDDLADRSLIYLFKAWYTDPEFLLMLGASTCLNLMHAFDAFVSLWLKGILPLVTNSTAGMAVAAIPCGIILSLLVLGPIIERFRPRNKAQVTLFLLFLECLTTAGLLTFTIVAERTGCTNVETCVGFAVILLLLMGFFVGYPYYIVPNVFACQYGQSRAATLSAMFEMTAAIFGAAFAQIYGNLSSASWIPVFAIVFALSLCAFFYLASYHFYMLRHKVNAINYQGTGISRQNPLDKARSKYFAVEDDDENIQYGKLTPLDKEKSKYFDDEDVDPPSPSPTSPTSNLAFAKGSGPGLSGTRASDGNVQIKLASSLHGSGSRSSLVDPTAELAAVEDILGQVELMQRNGSQQGSPNKTTAARPTEQRDSLFE
eukprot:gb/GEZN01003752.1/.p1 GENE.gb/GEZN01003752.1/~~gb/GEZN01003752.1/.p1  ORF type:complete len:692 (-),score=91.46 gb/GEZN01003752.1/:28-2070(-)